MSPPSGESTDAPDRDGDADGADDADWFDRHARVEVHTSDRWVRADPPRDDWHARHSRTKRRN